jgi:hypothetical protein
VYVVVPAAYAVDFRSESGSCTANPVGSIDRSGIFDKLAPPLGAAPPDAPVVGSKQGKMGIAHSRHVIVD